VKRLSAGEADGTCNVENWEIYESTFNITGEDGEYVIEYYSEDNAGNIEEIKTFYITLDNTPPSLELVSPSPQSEGVCVIFRATVPVIGKAEDIHFEKYELSYTPAETGENFLLAVSTSPISEEPIAFWNLNELEEGYYILKLSAHDLVGNTSETEARVYAGEPAYLFSYPFGKIPARGPKRIEPAYIAMDKDNNSYVTDRFLGRIHKFDPEGRPVKTFGYWPGQTTIGRPEGIAVDGEGNIYVADSLRERVIKMDAEGNLVMELGGSEEGKRLPAGEAGEKVNGRWCKKERGRKEKTFNRPTGVVIDSEGNIWVADRLNSRIQKFTPDGDLVEETTIYTGIYDNGHRHWRDEWQWWKGRQYSNPGGIAIDGEDNIFVADTHKDRVLKFSSSGEQLLEIGGNNEPCNVEGVTCNEKHKISGKGCIRYRREKEEDRPGEFCNPDGICVSGTGYIYVADSGNNPPAGRAGRIQKFDKYGNYVLEWGENSGQWPVDSGKWKKDKKTGEELRTPGGIAITTEGNAHVVDRDNNKILAYGLPEEAEEYAALGSIEPGGEEESAAVMKFDPDTGIPDETFRQGEVYSYPNPARGGTNPVLHVECGIADSVEFEIYNIAGEKVHSGFMENQPAIVNGKYAYESKWDVRGTASGVYIYLVRARKAGESEFRVMKKLAVIK